MPARDSAPASNPQLESLLDYLKRSRGFDFSAYKRSSLNRRVRVRMGAAGLTDLARYQDMLEADPEEFTRLFNTILINVTAFFRDGPKVWNYLAESVLPAIIDQSERTGRIRVWSAGCASGDEAYSIAMLLAEALGPDRFRERVKIYATDVDEEALGDARRAMYAERSVEDVPASLLNQYFDHVGDRYVLNQDLRRSVVFGRHDLVQDAPLSRIDLLLCRNCLMYFKAEAQSRILTKFHFSLKDGGVLFLGKAETLLGRTHRFAPLDVKRRLLTKPAASPPQRPSLFQPRGGDLSGTAVRFRDLRHGVDYAGQPSLEAEAPGSPAIRREWWPSRSLPLLHRREPATAIAEPDPGPQPGAGAEGGGGAGQPEDPPA